MGLFFMIKPAIFVYDLDLIQSILVKDFSYFHDHFLYHNVKDDLGMYSQLKGRNGGNGDQS